ncbi:hypothetical protein PACTADRAFT_36007 [Pachysolen tannophilus NRRL Y-2460]|uniref:Uncharacterized protein n=1 Tax=Pachysolen tannophilus NRRL Y-2460 TaxID=669874 RepID=A0A1E4TNP1_PACTA|nr:hypothetical protein PACTADRAFT_36007 [Pachysolen tannophilus NRRL Y-2460]
MNELFKTDSFIGQKLGRKTKQKQNTDKKLGQRPPLPPIEQFKLDNILNYISKQDDSISQLADSIKITNNNFSNDLSFELMNSIKFEQNEIVELKLRKLNKLVNNNNNSITKYNNHDCNNIRNKLDKLNIETDEILALINENSTNLQKITTKLYDFEQLLPVKERLFSPKSPNKQHYPNLYKFVVKSGDHSNTDTGSGSASVEKSENETENEDILIDDEEAENYEDDNNTTSFDDAIEESSDSNIQSEAASTHVQAKEQVQQEPSKSQPNAISNDNSTGASLSLQNLSSKDRSKKLRILDLSKEIEDMQQKSEIDKKFQKQEEILAKEEEDQITKGNDRYILPGAQGKGDPIKLASLDHSSSIRIDSNVNNNNDNEIDNGEQKSIISTSPTERKLKSLLISSSKLGNNNNININNNDGNGSRSSSSSIFGAPTTSTIISGRIRNPTSAILPYFMQNDNRRGKHSNEDDKISLSISENSGGNNINNNSLSFEDVRGILITKSNDDSEIEASNSSNVSNYDYKTVKGLKKFL